MKKYLVIGGAGYLGRAVVDEIVHRKFDVMVFSNVPSPELTEQGIQVILGDIRNQEELEVAFLNTDEETDIIHCASIISLEKKRNPTMMEVNIEGTKNVLEMCCKYPIHRLCYVSSVHALPPVKEGTVKTETSSFSPELVEGWYAKSKAIATQMVLDETKRGLEAVIVHPTGIIGAVHDQLGQTIPVMEAFLEGKLPMIIPGGHDLVDVRDVALGILSALDKGQTGRNYILSGSYHTIEEVLNLVAKEAKYKPQKHYLSTSFIRLGAYLLESISTLFGHKPKVTEYMANTLETFELYSHERASKELGYRPRPLAQSIRDIAVALKWKEPDTTQM